jgi:retinol dehydrogenase 12
MTAKLAVVTGANTGIGKATARQLASRGFSVVMGCRDSKKAEAARDELVSSGVPIERLTLLPLDLGSLDSIAQFARAFHERYASLSVLVNNAGLWAHERTVTTDGFETTFGVNHLGPFQLTRLLLDSLRAADHARIVNVSSELHRRGDVMRLLDDPMAERGSFRGLARYGDSKLANVLFTRKLAKSLAAESSHVTVNALHPGVIASDFMRGVNVIGRAFVKLFFKSPEAGAATSVFLASAPEVQGVSGKYFVDCKEKFPSRAAQDDDAAETLWTRSEELVGAPRVDHG